jgi:hypothetical protein
MKWTSLYSYSICQKIQGGPGCADKRSSEGRESESEVEKRGDSESVLRLCFSVVALIDAGEERYDILPASAEGPKIEECGASKNCRPRSRHNAEASQVVALCG